MDTSEPGGWSGERLSYPLDEIQGPLGTVSIAKGWLYSFFWSTSLITGYAVFDEMPRDPALVVYVCATAATGSSCCRRASTW